MSGERNPRGTRPSTYDSVKEYYGKVLSSSKDLKTTACTAGGRPSGRIRQLLRHVPGEILEKFYGCGAPLPLGIDGLRVLDLGSGSGRDCYLCAALVGHNGSVLGMDMTKEQLKVAERYIEEYTKSLGLSQPNMSFVEGHMEYLDRAGIGDETMDLVISNCVINLSPDKERVLEEAYRVLAPGGELYFSDVYSDRRVPLETQKNEVLWGECIAGALYIEDFKSMARAAGFTDPRFLSISPITINDPEIRQLVGPIRFYSITARLFKLPGLLEPACEDYGQFATYKGTIEGHEFEYVLDGGHTFEKGKPSLVCGNTAAMLGETGISWLSRHFQVVGDRSTHYGKFDCNATASLGKSVESSAEGCGNGSCC